MKYLFFTIICLTSTFGFSQNAPFKLIKKNGDTINFELYSYNKKEFTYSTEKPTRSNKPKISLFGIGKRLTKLKNGKKILLKDIEKLILNTSFSYAREKDAKFFVPYSKFIKIKNKYRKLEVITEGYCDLYIDLNDTTAYNFYVKRKNEDNATEIQAHSAFGARFKKVGPKYFNDCPTVLELISESEYKTRLDFLLKKLEKIVISYNKDCNKI